jgi:hypothetical protein
MPRLLLLLLAFAAAPAHASIYKWVDENGKVQYSDKPPAAQSQAKQGVTELNNRGMTVKQIEGLLTPEQRAARDAQLAKEKEAQQQQDEARRRDRALLNTFSNTREIDRIRDQNLDQLAAGIQSDQLRHEAVQKRIDQYNKQLDRFTKAKKPAPPDLVSDLDDRKAELAKIDDEMRQKQQAIVDVKARAESDKKRLIELRGAGAAAK